MLLLEHFVTNPSTWSYDEFNIFAICVNNWLFGLPESAREQNIAESPNPINGTNMGRILLKVHSAVNLLLARKDLWYGNDNRPGFNEDNNLDWLFWLPHRADTIVVRHNRDTYTTAMFRDFLHTLVQAYRLLNFMNNDEWPSFLHDNLRKIHGIPCDVPKCPWNSHTCNNANLKTCPLLRRDRRAHAPLVIPSRCRGQLNPYAEGASTGHNYNLLARCMSWITRETSGPPANTLELAELGGSSRLASRVAPCPGRITFSQLLNLLRWMHGSLTPLGTVPEEFMKPWILAQSDELPSVLLASSQPESEQTSPAFMESTLEPRDEDDCVADTLALLHEASFSLDVPENGISPKIKLMPSEEGPSRLRGGQERDSHETDGTLLRCRRKANPDDFMFLWHS